MISPAAGLIRFFSSKVLARQISQWGRSIRGAANAIIPVRRPTNGHRDGSVVRCSRLWGSHSSTRKPSTEICRINLAGDFSRRMKNGHLSGDAQFGDAA